MSKPNIPTESCQRCAELENPLPRTEVAVIAIDEKGDVLVGRAQDGIDKDKLTVPVSYILPFESMSDAAKRTVFEWARIDIAPQGVLFVCESISQKQESHRIVIFVSAEPLGRKLRAEDAMWVNLNSLGDYQDQMSDLAVDGFYKLSLVLKIHAGKMDAQAPQTQA